MNRALLFNTEALAPHLISLTRIVSGLLFFQHGAEKLWGFAGGRMEHNFLTLRGFAGPLEVVGGALIILGLFTRTTAFILSGEMAVAYFRSWAPRGFFPIANGGEEATIFSFLFLWLVTVGAGPLSLDRVIEARRSDSQGVLKQRIVSWDGYGRALLRIVLAFTFTLHGLRLAFGMFPGAAGRRIGSPMPLDQLPQVMGYIEIAAGLLLMIGLFARASAAVSSVIALSAYVYAAAPRGIWPIRNGGNEALLYFLVFLYISVAGAGCWSLSEALRRSSARRHDAAVTIGGRP